MNCLTTKYLVQITSSEKFSNANGILISMRGIGCLIGPFFAGENEYKNTFLLLITYSNYSLNFLKGYLSEKTNPFWSFIFAGSSFIISFVLSVMCILMHQFSRKKSADNTRI